MRLNIIISFLLLLGCTDIEYIIEPPISIETGSNPTDFNVTIVGISDRWVNIEWEIHQDNADRLVKYEVAVNDSIVAYDLVSSAYRINDLEPNTKYKITVVALDSYRNATNTHIDVHTMKSFVEGVISLNFDFESYGFNKIIATNDNGLLLAGTVTERVYSESNLPFIIKLDDSYNIELLHIFQSTDQIVDLLESDDNNYIVIKRKSICKIDKTGNELWVYHVNFIADDLLTIECATRDLEGNYVISGTSNRNWGTDVSLEYCLFKISANGELCWNKFGGTTLFTQAKDIIVGSDGRIIVFGSSEHSGKGFDQIGYNEESFWLLWTDENGNFLKQKFYENQYNETDLPHAIYPTADDNYLLLGTATGYMPPHGYYNTMPRFLKISKEGEVIWEQYQNLNSGGVFPYIRGFDEFSNGDYLLLCLDDRGMSINTVSKSTGQLGRAIKLYGYPRCIFIKVVENDNFHGVTGDGRIILFNNDGYLE